MSQRLRAALASVVALAAFALARGPLHRATFALPVSNDDAILLLMGRHVLRGELATTLWNQPYNGALDAYLLAPLLALLPHHAAYRLYQLLGALLLVVLVGLLARRLGGPAAGAAAALLAAWGTPYMALMATTGPPPNFLMPLVTGFPLLAALAAADQTAPRPRPWRALAVGLVCGLAVWCSSLAIPAFAGMLLGLALSGFRPRPAALVSFGLGGSIGVAPLALAHLIGAAGAGVETAASAVTAIRPTSEWEEGAKGLWHAISGLVGLQVPLVVDGPQRALLPAALVVALAFGLLVALVAGGRSRGVPPLVGWAAALAGAFWLSRRTGPDELRYLYGLNAPLLALAGAGLGVLWQRRRVAAVGVGACLLVPWAWGDRLLLDAWRDPSFAERVWEVPSIEPAVAALRAAGTRSAYASLQLAGRISLETDEQVIASQAWNERIPGDPLRFRDEVDLDPAPAWVLSRRLSRGMPRAGGFRELVKDLGGGFAERQIGSLTVFDAFRPPYDELRPVPRDAIRVLTTGGQPLGPAVLDRDPASRWRSAEGVARGGGLLVRVSPARRLSALVLAVDLRESPLAVPWTALVAGEVVASGPVRAGLQWVNGAPRAGKQALLVATLGDRLADEVRLVFQGPGPRLALSEVFLYGKDEIPVTPRGADAAGRAYAAARAGHWDDALRLYAEAVRLEPDRASYHACWARARWRAAGRRWLDVESLDDGGPDLVGIR